MFERLEEATLRYLELEKLVGTPDLASNPSRLREVAQEMATLRESVEAYRRWKELQRRLEDSRGMLSDPDPELRELAQTEASELETELASCEVELKRLLVPRDPNDGKN